MTSITATILPACNRPADRCVHTGRVQIGIAHQRPPLPIESRDALTLQRALLEPRTDHPPGLLALIFGGFWKWL